MYSYTNRASAGQQLAERLTNYARQPNVLVLGLPRGGLPVAAEVAKSLDAPLDVFVVRKLGVPGQEELAMGAIATGDVCVLNWEIVHGMKISQQVIDEIVRKERVELQRREQNYREGRPAPNLQGQTVILIDDGLATGSTMRAAILAVRHLQPRKLIVAIPVAPVSTCAELEREVDELVCLQTPEPFYAVGMWYEDFSQTTDDEVRNLLRESLQRSAVREEADRKAGVTTHDFSGS